MEGASPGLHLSWVQEGKRNRKGREVIAVGKKEIVLILLYKVLLIVSIVHIKAIILLTDVKAVAASNPA